MIFFTTLARFFTAFLSVTARTNHQGTHFQKSDQNLPDSQKRHKIQLYMVPSTWVGQRS
ncbi:hypothetical protein M758_1G047100 [Ceratodon purpureus]|nr:hypothetical protein M758_1G047100 [Ceratodon purpureus]